MIDPRCARLLVVLSGCVSYSAPAAATNSIPRAADILVSPLDPAHLVVRSDSWGIFVSKDGGQSFEFVCANAWGGTAHTESHTGMAFGADGTLYVANRFRGLWMSREGCAFSRVEPESDGCSMGSCAVTYVTSAQGGRQIVALRVTGSSDSRTITVELRQSTDAGTTWSPLGAPLVGDFGAAAVAVSPANPRRLWLTGHSIDGPRLVQRSDDAGMSWKPVLASDEGQSLVFRPFGSSPVDENVFFVHADDPDDLGDGAPDEIWATWNGGDHFEPVFQGTGSLYGAVDQDEVWVSGPNDGLWRASMDRLAVEGQAAFARVLAPKTYAVARSGSGLYVGTDEFAGADARLATLSLLGEAGTLSSVLSLCEAPAAACAASCDAVVEAYELNFITDATCTEAPVDAGSPSGRDSGRDAQTLPDPVAMGVTTYDGGCGCRVANRTFPTGMGAAFTALLLACGRRAVAGISRSQASVRLACSTSSMASRRFSRASSSVAP